MLTKHTEIEISRENPFNNDKLGRKKIVENLTLLIQSTNQPFVISIEAPWGWGKTTFINLWKTHLEILGHTCLYFNAWENDFVQDPLIAFIGEINKSIGEMKSNGKSAKRLKKLQSIGGKLVRHALPITIQIATQGLLSQESVKKASDILFTSSDEIAGYASKLAEEQIRHYDSDKRGIIEFRKELTEFAKSLTEEKSKKPPLVFFVDELDRCRPDFSIALLERIKHVFNAEGIVFVLGIDREQIEESIKSIYGQGMKSDGYLRRFIDYRLRLPMPSPESFCKFLFEEFHMHEVFAKRRDRLDEQDTLIRVFSRLAESFGFSLRVIEQCFTEINLILRTTALDTGLFPDILAILVALRAHKYETYAMLGKKLTYPQAEKIIKEMQQDLNMEDSLSSTISAIFESHLLQNNLEEDVRNSVYKTNETIMGSDNHSEAEKDYARRLISFMRDFAIDKRYRRSIEFLSSRLDAIKDLMA